MHARSASRILLLAPLVLALVTAACVNPFKPADPEPPDASGVLENFSDPESVLVTMERAIENRSTNGSNAYLHAYAESTVAGDRAFRAYYDDAVKTGWQSATQQTAPEPWTIDLERNVHSVLSGLRPSFIYDWQWRIDETSTRDEVTPDTVLFHRRYYLYAAPKDGSAETIVIGMADLSLQRKEGRWSLYRWVDRVDPAVTANPTIPDQRTMSWRRLESLAK